MAHGTVHSARDQHPFRSTDNVRVVDVQSELYSFATDLRLLFSTHGRTMFNGTRYRSFLIACSACHLMLAGCTSEDGGTPSSTQPLLRDVSVVAPPEQPASDGPFLGAANSTQNDQVPTIHNNGQRHPHSINARPQRLPAVDRTAPQVESQLMLAAPAQGSMSPSVIGTEAPTLKSVLVSEPANKTTWPVHVPDSPALTTEDLARRPTPELQQQDSTPAAPPITEPRAQPVAQPASGRISDAVAAVARQAEKEIQAGYALANRGATFSARNRFLKALRIVAEAIDAERGQKYHSLALERGLVAMEEAEDFLLGENQQAEAIDVTRCVASHRTPVLKDAPTDRLTPIIALQHYFTYSQEQLVIAGGRVPASSGALHYLGKLYSILDGPSEHASELNTPKSMVYHQAALISDPSNYMAANELGVLLARLGQLHDAKRVLIAGLRVQEEAIAWRNLATIHDRLGEHELAQLARQEVALLQRQRPPSATNSEPIVWLPNDQFARTNPEAPLAPTAKAPTPAVPPKAKTAQKKSNWFGGRW